MRNAGMLLSLLLAGCATAPAYRPPAVDVPPAFREVARERAARDSAARAGAAVGPAATATASDGFWRELGDTVLNRLMDQALRANLDLQAAEARVRGARAARAGAALDLAPTVTFAGGYTRQRLSTATFPIGLASFPDQDIWDGGFDASWELDLFGRLRRNLQAQGAFVAVAREDLRDVQVSLTAELARSYFDLRGGQEQLAVAQRNAENQRRTLDLTRERLAAGQGTAFDTERAQAQLSLTLASVPTLEGRVAAAEYQIGVLLGRPPASVAGELDIAAGLPALPDSVSVARPDSLVRRRPDVAAAERLVAAQHALVGSAKADYLPRITVGANAGFTATTFDSLGERGTFRYAVGPVISWPALNLGRVKAQVNAAQAREAEAQAQYTQAVLRALQEVETSLARYRTARARAVRIEDAASASERAAELARLRFTEGVADFLQVLDAERTLLDAQNQASQARTDAATAYAALYKALGGTWPGAEGAGS
jgi:NodT family efflux transporter outer membrane factor (OMF) lipoprotein